MVEDDRWMREALRLAARGRMTTSPNPMVGAMVVKDGVLAGSGWHRRAGEPHAEVLALAEAGDRARGATVYVTLEPCAHSGRTPPCAQALIDAGVARVVAALTDPDPRTAGKGLEALRRAGIAVTEGLLSDRARRLNEAYVHHRLTGRPLVTYKAGLSLDGQTAAADGSSQWITSEEARRDAHRLRAECDAIACGVGTILADDPRLTPRGVRVVRQPLRVVIDSSARTPPGSRVLEPPAPTMIATSSAESHRVVALKEAGAEVVAAPGRDGSGVDLDHLLRLLGDRGILSLLVEGGATLAAALCKLDLIDRYVLYLAPKLMGANGTGVLRGWAALTLDDAVELEIGSYGRVGPDLKVVAYPRRSG